MGPAWTHGKELGICSGPTGILGFLPVTAVPRLRCLGIFYVGRGVLESLPFLRILESRSANI